MSARVFPSIAEVDVLVIGGGIVGAGVARDAAMRGLRTMLVEQNDFASGTSSRSSRLLHGGIRYLAQGRIGLVREASREKIVLHHIAAHLAAPLPFVFPTHRSGPWKLWKLRIGVKMYDWLCGRGNLGKSSAFNRDEILAAMPGLNAEDLTGAVRYFDGFTNDARLVMDTLRSAAGAGAVVLNYAAAANARQDGKIWRCEVRDQLSGNVANVMAHTVVNASGAWAMNFPASGVKLRLTKGVHLVVNRRKLPVTDAVVMTESTRILFAIPWGERVILGTTDTDYAGPPGEVRCELDDAKYVLGVVNQTFPSVKIELADVISTWAGVRPLVGDPHGKPSDISRRHEIKMSQPGWFDVTGGKLTTYRLMAEQTIDQIVQYSNRYMRGCETATIPLLADEAKFSGVLPPVISKEAVEHFCRQEWAIHLSDVMIRRTSWQHYYPNHLDIARQVAEWMAEILDWNAESTRLELEKYAAEAKMNLAEER